MWKTDSSSTDDDIAGRYGLIASDDQILQCMMALRVCTCVMSLNTLTRVLNKCKAVKERVCMTSLVSVVLI